MVVFSQFGDIMRYLYKNQDSFCKVIYTAFTYLIMLVLGYGIALAQSYSFMQGIEVDPKNLPFFQYDLAQKTYQYTQSFHIAGTYGLFRQITGVKDGRPELILQGSMDFDPSTGEGEWKEYEFFYKPGRTSEIGEFI